MRSCLFHGVLAAILAFCTTASLAQDMLGASRPVKGVNRPTEAAPPEPLPAAPTGRSGVTVARDAKLNAGDEITVLIREDRDPALRTVVTDTGEVEINGLGRVYVAGKNSIEAEVLISSYLKQRFYHQATVEVGIVRKMGDAVRPSKVVVSGKVGRPGPQYFTSTNPLKLSEAVIVSSATLYSDLRKVKLTRGGRSTEHDVNAINKEGRTDLDVSLRDGDAIYVPAVGWKFRSDN